MSCRPAGEKQRLPKTIYSDSESALTSKEIQDWFKETNIIHITTQGHAPVAERTIRTIKALYENRKKHNQGNNNWKVIIQDSVNAYNDHIHSATGMTPVEAEKPEDQDEVKEHLEGKRVSTRRYPRLYIGDHVRLYRKKNALDKERIPVHSEIVHTVKENAELGTELLKN